MALTEAQKLKIVRIIGNGLTSFELDDRLEYYAEHITAQVETDVASELTRWDAAGTNFTKVHPREKNFGAEINPGEEKNDIRKNIAAMLFLQDYIVSGGSRLVRA